MNSISYCIVFDISFLMYKICIFTLSMAYLCRVQTSQVMVIDGFPNYMIRYTRQHSIELNQVLQIKFPHILRGNSIHLLHQMLPYRLNQKKNIYDSIQMGSTKHTRFSQEGQSQKPNSLEWTVPHESILDPVQPQCQNHEDKRNNKQESLLLFFFFSFIYLFILCFQKGKSLFKSRKINTIRGHMVRNLSPFEKLHTVMWQHSKFSALFEIGYIRQSL